MPQWHFDRTTHGHSATRNQDPQTCWERSISELNEPSKVELTLGLGAVKWGAMHSRKTLSRSVPLAALIVGGLLGSVGVAQPRSSRSTDWSLDVQFHDPQRIRIRLPGDRESTTFWYMLYQVTNNTGRDRNFYPSFRLVTDSLEVVEAGNSISPIVYDYIVGRHRREYPFLAPPAKVTGLLLQGEPNARASVAVFRDFDPQANAFTIYASGLSGTIRRITNPAFKGKVPESESNPRAFVQRMTLAIYYELPGDAITREFAAPIRRRREWVMR